MGIQLTRTISLFLMAFGVTCILYARVLGIDLTEGQQLIEYWHLYIAGISSLVLSYVMVDRWHS